ncbi:hypothetical protein [Flavobacterium terrisoli]|uniref:hypothetical protein n=1 Tax=Flavobacterium terrisoli TaxID=3242195 RepID=UPI002542CF3B|nr:hypothetical protein [Flavobacterium buctense]
MDTLKLSELIGQEIEDLRFHYIPENEYGLQSFHTYIKLANNWIIDIPKYDDDDYLNLTYDNLDYYKKMFEAGKSVPDKLKTSFAGQTILDFYFSYDGDEVDFDQSAFIKLSNNLYLSENNFGPMGLTTIDLIIFNEEQFTAEVQRLKDNEIEVRSFLNTKNAG